MEDDGKGKDEEKKEEEEGAPVASAAETGDAAEVAGAPATGDAPMQGVEVEEEEAMGGTKTPVHDWMQEEVDGVKVHVITETSRRTSAMRSRTTSVRISAAWRRGWRRCSGATLRH